MLVPNLQVKDLNPHLWWVWHLKIGIKSQLIAAKAKPTIPILHRLRKLFFVKFQMANNKQNHTAFSANNSFSHLTTNVNYIEDVRKLDACQLYTLVRFIRLLIKTEVRFKFTCTCGWRRSLCRSSLMRRQQLFGTLMLLLSGGLCC